MGFFQKISEGLKKTKENMMQKVNQIFSSFRPVDEELFEELEETLIMSDVGMITAEEVCNRLRKGVKERGITDSGEVKALSRSASYRVGMFVTWPLRKVYRALRPIKK